jgi:hypothetical protein
LKPIIEQFVLPQEKLDELKTALANPKLGSVQKNSMLRHTGACLVCGQMATKIIKCRMFGVTVIQKYCDDCLARRQLKKS